MNEAGHICVLPVSPERPFATSLFQPPGDANGLYPKGALLKCYDCNKWWQVKEHWVYCGWTTRKTLDWLPVRWPRIIAIKLKLRELRGLSNEPTLIINPREAKVG